MFHVDEMRNPHSKSLEFHNPHSIEANNPLALTAYESLRVKLVNSNTMDTAKSKKLWNAQTIKISYKVTFSWDAEPA